MILLYKRSYPIRNPGIKPDLSDWSLGAELLDLISVYHMLHLTKDDVLYYQAPPRNKHSPKKALLDMNYLFYIIVMNLVVIRELERCYPPNIGGFIRMHFCLLK